MGKVTHAFSVIHRAIAVWEPGRGQKALLKAVKSWVALTWVSVKSLVSCCWLNANMFPTAAEESSHRRLPLGPRFIRRSAARIPSASWGSTSLVGKLGSWLCSLCRCWQYDPKMCLFLFKNWCSSQHLPNTLEGVSMKAGFQERPRWFCTPAYPPY